MNPGGPSGGAIPGLIPRAQQVTLSGGRVINITSGTPVANPNPPPPPPGMRRSVGSKLMRLRCRFRPLHDQYIKNGTVLEDDTDVIFICGDGHQIRAHKVIMASSSKFFAKIFEDQTGKTAVVSVPDIKVDTMKLILQLTYKDRIYLTMSQIKEVGEFITIFGMAWTQFGYEEYHGDEPLSAAPLPPVPMKPVDLPRKVVHVSPKAGQGQIPRKVVSVSASPGRSPMQQSAVNGNDVDENNQQGLSTQQAQCDRRKSRLTPRPGTEGEEIVEQDGEEDPENRIKDWMSKLGKRESISSSDVVSAKRDQNDEPQTANVCSVCNTKFVTNIAWRWHEERHVGTNMFKCKFCDDLSKNPKACYIHEKEVHGYSGLQHGSPSRTSSKTQPGSSRPTTATVVLRANQSGKFVPVGVGQQHQNFKRIKLQSYKKLQGKKKPGNPNFVNRYPQIGIGESQGSELIDTRKIKQLHWLYVCQRCDHCSDSSQKAQSHYNICYPEKETKFEETVMKYRQGFYGKNKCPLCPRRYPQNTGFMIHCGHQHQDYRRLFTHTGASDDQIKCINCKEAFPEPMSFHEHLDSGADGSMHCPEEPKEEAATENVEKPAKPAPVATRSSEAPTATAKPSRPPRQPRRPESPIEHKAQYKVQFHTPPKSARLASRVRAEAEAEAEAASKKAKPADINFPPVDCPVCGDSDLPNISAHLKSKHKDLNVDVTRISSELLRCKGCTITFDICDLLDHKNCLLNDQESPAEDADEANASSRRTSTSSASTSKASKAAVVVDVDSLPPGVGRSPIEKIEIEDLHSIEAIRTALKCLVCGKEAMKLGAIADCLRSHGVHRCSLCFNSYCNKADYGTHLRKCHGAGGKLKCPLCPKAFANAGQTSGHMYSTHWLAILKENETAMKSKSKAAGSSNASKAGNQSKAEEESTDPSKQEDNEDESGGLVIDENQEDKENSDAKKEAEVKEDEDVEID